MLSSLVAGLPRMTARYSLFLVAVAACAPEAAVAPATPPAAPVAAPAVAAPAAVQIDDARGGRLYDQWRSELGTQGFVPDSSKTPELDGQGGPNGNGTLNDVAGKALANTGHDYRLKNLFGWDLRGKAGIYGPEYMNKPYVLERNLLEDTRPAPELRAWLQTGDAQFPGLGTVLDAAALDQLVEFLVKVRSRQLPQPSDVYSLAKDAPKFYRLNPGADVERGKRLIAQRCNGCHGADGTKIKIDEVESIGSISRSSGYEIWLKIMNGHPGSKMGRQVAAPSAAEQAREILDVLAALCDRNAFPALARDKDVPNGDARCGAYLK